MIFDPALIQRGARIKRSPYFEATQRAGCRGYTVYNHMLLPIRYASFEEEYRRLLAGVTLWDVSVERNVEIAGRDGARLMELLTPRDLSQCKVGEGRYVLITDEAGGIVNDPVLLRIEENRYWLACADSDVVLWAKGVAHGLRLEVEVRELDVAPLQIQGPRSRELVRDLFGDRVDSMKYYHWFRAELDQIPLIVTRTGWTGELGFELYLLQPERGVDLWNRVLKAGRKYNIAPTGPCDIRRIEAGILNYGIDMTLENNPYEVGLERLVNLDKGEFIGREALQRIARQGPSRKLVGVEIGGGKMDMNMTRYPVKGGGFVTSCLYSPRLKKNIGYAMLPIERSKVGTKLKIEAPKGVRNATVVPMPFIDPKKTLAKS